MTEYVDSEAELREIVGDPGPVAHAKVLRELDVHARDYIARSRFCLLATSGADGTDVSPRGEPGSVALVLDEKTLVLPDRPGNKRVDSLRNILHNPRVGMLFLMPPMAETLRINGRARIVREAPYLADLAVRGRPPKLAVEISVDEVYLHCAKAFMRSDLWDPQTWNDRDELPRAAQIWRDHAQIAASVDEIDGNLRQGYAKTLY
jgi:PPOX class probable FMN-dependent enzyme